MTKDLKECEFNFTKNNIKYLDELITNKQMLENKKNVQEWNGVAYYSRNALSGFLINYFYKDVKYHDLIARSLNIWILNDKPILARDFESIGLAAFTTYYYFNEGGIFYFFKYKGDNKFLPDQKPNEAEVEITSFVDMIIPKL